MKAASEIHCDDSVQSFCCQSSALLDKIRSELECDRKTMVLTIPWCQWALRWCFILLRWCWCTVKYFLQTFTLKLDHLQVWWPWSALSKESLILRNKHFSIFYHEKIWLLITQKCVSGEFYKKKSIAGNFEHVLMNNYKKLWTQMEPTFEHILWTCELNQSAAFPSLYSRARSR